MRHAPSSSRLASRVYYGWFMLGGISVSEMVSWGILYYTFTVFLQPMRAALGWSTTALTGAFSLALLCSAAAALPIGRWLDRHGARWLMTIGSCMAALLLLAWAKVASLAAYYAIWVGLGIAMAAVLYDPAFALVATWFRALRGRALTILTFIAGFASVIFVPLAQWLVQLQGWRMALVSLAALLAVVTIPIHALLLRRRPADLGLAPDGSALSTPAAAPRHAAASTRGTSTAERSVPTRAALRGHAFRWIAATFALNQLAAGAITVHLVPYLIGQRYPPAFAASMLGLIGIMALPGRLIFTPLGDRVSRHVVIALLCVLQAVALPVLLLVPGVVGVVSFVVVFGAGFGAITPARAALVAHHYGSTHYARINSILGLFVSGARALAPVGVGLAYDLLRGYTITFWGLAAISLLAAGAILLADDLTPRPPSLRGKGEAAPLAP